ncbi:hypothetical protein ACET3Z_026158 [Daucus carota]
MAIKRRELMRLNGVTVFAVPDASLFSVSNGFRYDFSHHVIKKRMRLTEISRIPIGTVMETMSPNKSIVLGENEGRVTVNGVEINVTEVYHNRWIVVISILGSLDDVVVIPPPEIAFSSEAHVFSPSPSDSTGVSSISQAQSPDSESFASLVESPESVPSPTPIYYPEDENVGRESSQSPSPIASGDENAGESPLLASSPDESAVRCLSEVPDGGDSAVFLAVEGEDIFCPVSIRRKLDQSNAADVAPSQPSDLVRGSKGDQSEPLMRVEVISESKRNDEVKKESRREDQYMADDLFFYT